MTHDTPQARPAGLAPGHDTADEAVTPERRLWLRQAARLGALGAGAMVGANASARRAHEPLCEPPPPADPREPFWGVHQGGIATPMQQFTYFVAFDVVSKDRGELIKLLQSWTQAAAAMTQSAQALDPHADPMRPPHDDGASVDLGTARLTLTFGLGASLFDKDGQDRFGLAAQRPAALVDLPRFVGDQLLAERTGGDLSVQACADNPQVVQSAVRQLARLAKGVAVMRWAQSGYSGNYPHGQTGRNQMGFKDGTLNIDTRDAKRMQQFVWVGDEGPAWMRQGSYMVIRPIRIALEHWDEMKQGFQEQTVGRMKASGAPLGKSHEQEALDLDRVGKDGQLLEPEESHAAMTAPQNNADMQILRRAFSYDNGVAKIAERWPPWRQAVTFDAGLLFQCYQRDPRTGFIPMYAKMAQIDMLNQFTTHVGSGLFAVVAGVQPGGYIADALLG